MSESLYNIVSKAGRNVRKNVTMTDVHAFIEGRKPENRSGYTIRCVSTARPARKAQPAKAVQTKAQPTQATRPAGIMPNESLMKIGQFLMANGYGNLNVPKLAAEGKAVLSPKQVEWLLKEVAQVRAIQAVAEGLPA